MPFTYQQRSPESVQARAESQGGKFDRMFNRDIVMYKPHDGENSIRILPPTWPNADHWGYDMYVHYGVGPDKQSYLSLSRHHNQPDPVDEAATQAAREGNDELEKQLRAKRRVGIWLIDRKDPTKGPQFWASPSFAFDREVVQQSRDKQTGEVLAVDDPDGGYDVFFTKTGKNFGTKYEGVSVARRSTPLSQDPAERERWLDYVSHNPIPALLKFYPYDRIKSVFEGTAAPSGFEEVAPTAPPAEPPSAPANPSLHPGLAHAAPAAPVAPVAGNPAPTAPAAPAAATTAPVAPAAPVDAAAEANLAAQQAQAHQAHAPQAPVAPAPTLPNPPTRTRPAMQEEGYDDDISF